jgi:hypothetical protein
MMRCLVPILKLGRRRVIMDNLPVYKAPGVPKMIEASGAILL